MCVINNDNVIYSFSPNMKAMSFVKVGDIVVFESNDCFYQQVNSNDDVLESIDHERLNPATGPVHVKGVKPGDVLIVDILSIDIADRGVTAVVPGEGALKEAANNGIVRVIPIVDGAAEYLGLRIPVKPMIGVIGVAPSDENGACPTNTPYRHGGNMDTADIRQGTSLYLPVSQEGALFALGDCHALMGDGEVSFTGLEIPANVTLRFGVMKNIKINWPILRTETETMIIASGKNFDDAMRHCVNDAVNSLANIFRCQWEEAYILASMVVDVRVSQVVDPNITVRAVIPSSIATTAQIVDAFR